MKLPELHVIGILHGDIKHLADAPKNYSESNKKGTLEIFPQYQDGLDGINPGQTIVVLCWLDKSDRTILKVHPRGDHKRKIRGVFSTRSPARPNPIAISEFKVHAVKGTLLEVSGIDILDGSPIVDIKMKISK